MNPWAPVETHLRAEEEETQARELGTQALTPVLPPELILWRQKVRLLPQVFLDSVSHGEDAWILLILPDNVELLCMASAYMAWAVLCPVTYHASKGGGGVCEHTKPHHTSFPDAFHLILQKCLQLSETWTLLFSKNKWL